MFNIIKQVFYPEKMVKMPNLNMKIKKSGHVHTHIGMIQAHFT